MIDERPRPHVWLHLEGTQQSIAASRRVLERSEETVSRVRAAIQRANAILNRIQILLGRGAPPLNERRRPPTEP